MSLGKRRFIDVVEAWIILGGFGFFLLYGVIL